MTLNDVEVLVLVLAAADFANDKSADAMESSNDFIDAEAEVTEFGTFADDPPLAFSWLTSILILFESTLLLAALAE